MSGIRRWAIALGVLLLGRKKRQPRFADRTRIVPPGDPDPRAEWLVLLLLLAAAGAAVGFIVFYSFNHLAHQTQYLGLALGLGYWQRTRLIVLPQALALVIPPLVNNFISAFKSTSLVLIIGLFDLLGATNAALNDANWRGYSIEAYVFVAAIYFSFCFFMSRYSQMLEREFNKGRQR